MSSYGRQVNGKIFAMFVRDRVVVKLPRQQVDQLVDTKQGERFDPGHGRSMKEWLSMESLAPGPTRRIHRRTLLPVFFLPLKQRQ